MTQLNGEAAGDVTDTVRSIIAEQIKIPVDSLDVNTKLKDLGVESLDVIEIIFTLEEKYGIEIPYNANQPVSVDFDTIAQVAAAVEKLVSEKAH
jgi:acyl carrier protein